MRKKKIILHIGYSKCGSTTIQETLSGNYFSLLQEGILFPRVMSESPSWLRFFWEPDLPITYPEEKVKNKFFDFWDRLKVEVSGSPVHTVILSDEGLISLPRSGVRALKNFMSDFFEGYEFEIVCIVREPISFFESRCQQFISERYFDSRSVERFIKGECIENGEVRSDCYAMNPRFLFSENIGKYRDLFTKVRVLSLESAIDEGCGLTRYFLRSIGIENSLSDIKRNESRSDKAIEVMSYINSKLPFNVSSGSWKYRRYGDLAMFSGLKGEKYSLPRELKGFVGEKVESEIFWLNNNYGINYRLNRLSEEPSRIFWDDGFYREVVKIYPGLPFHIKIVFKSFIVDNFKGSDLSNDVGVEQTRRWLKDNYPVVYACNNHFAFLWLKVLGVCNRLIGKRKSFFLLFKKKVY